MRNEKNETNPKNGKNWKKLILLLFIIVAVFLVWLNYFAPAKNTFKTNSIKNFADCKKAGYPIFEIFPEQCRTPDGRLFTRDMQKELKK